MLELHDFLQKNRVEILAMTELKTLELTGSRPTSHQLKQGLPIFYQQLLEVLRLDRPAVTKTPADKAAMKKAANETDEPALAEAAGDPEVAEVAKSAGHHGVELLRLGYTLSHVVHAYGSICQSITELATKQVVAITTSDFHDLNQCLDVAIAGAVTEYQTHRDTQETTREVRHLGFLAHELRNALNTVNLSIDLIREGTVGFGGSTGKVLERNLKRIEDLIDGSLTEVRLRVDPVARFESGHLLQIVDQILITARIEARSKKQTFQIQIDPTLNFQADQQAFHSALSNLIQNALKYTPSGGKIQVRGYTAGEGLVVEVEDECGGLLSKAEADLFKPFVQNNKDRKGLGLGLTIAQRAIELNQGTIDVVNLPGKGCIFKIKLPKRPPVMAPR